jgi:hypothetical protein
MTPGARMRSVAPTLSASVEEVTAWLDGVTYKDGWSFTPEFGTPHTVLVVRERAEDSRGGAALVVNHRFPLPLRSVVDDRRAFVGWLRHVVGKVELHERDEWLLVDKRRLFDPHGAIDLRDS